MHASTPTPLTAHTHTRAARMGRFPAISPHRGSIKCLVHACCSHVTLTDSRMNDLFGGLFNCQRWMASIGVLSLLMNQAICHFKQIYPRVVVQARPQRGLQGPPLSLQKTGLKMKEKQVRRGKLLSRQKHIAAYTLSPALLPFSLFDIFMQI